MTKTTIFAAAVTVAAAILPATAAFARDTGAGAQTFVHNGNTYVYTMKTVGDRSVIDGRSYPGGSGFHLVVRNGVVSGTTGGVPISFSVASTRGAAGGVEVAAR